MTPSTEIDFGIRGAELRVDRISQKLGIAPTSGFNPNESYFGKTKEGNEVRIVERQRPDFGVWHFSTHGLVPSSVLEEHAQFLLSILEPVKPQIEELLQLHIYSIQLTFWHVGPAGFDFKSLTMARLAALSSQMSFTCFENSDEYDSSDSST